MTRSPSTKYQSLDFVIGKGGLFFSFVLLMGLTPGCLDGSISNAVFETKSSGEPVVEATQNALKMIGYLIGEKTDTKDASKGTRAIDGERMGMVTGIGPSKMHIQIVIKPLEKGSEIQVGVIPPRGAYGTTAIPLHDYEYALSQLLPDLRVKSRKVPWL